MSPEDAHVLERHFSPELSAHDLSHLSAFQAACRPSIQGGHGRAFTFTTKPLEEGSEKRAADVRRRSAELFAESRDQIEEDIRSRQRNAVSLLLPVEPSEESSPKKPDQSGVQSVSQSGVTYGAQPRLRGVKTDDSMREEA